jgi:choline dehydrogenase-like flavoprotein
MDNRATDVLVIGSGAGGSVTALELATRGRDVLILEDGKTWSDAEYGMPPSEGMRRLYRRRGMTPIMGVVPIGYVEGCCVGGSTEINSGFWHRTPREILLRWKSQFDLAASSPDELEEHFEWAENLLGVSKYPGAYPASRPWGGRGKRFLAPRPIAAATTRALRGAPRGPSKVSAARSCREPGSSAYACSSAAA